MHEEFLKQLWTYYDANRRDALPWRQNTDPYYVLVSEIMLQQTQVGRVIPKFEAFIEQFPSIGSLASASLADVLRAWQGLGYNRRAKFLWQAAAQVVERFKGEIPRDAKDLVSLPGIGPNTAGAILAYAYNLPASFIETNVRSVLIYHFFPEEEKVSDNALRAVLDELIPKNNPRDFYWALMDYGTHLKETIGNHSRRSAVYAKQSRFEGSNRQVRGRILRALHAGELSEEALLETLADQRAAIIIADMLAEGLIERHNTTYHLPGENHV